jgi:inosine-uridine nucleoside N-ribohydrolase
VPAAEPVDGDAVAFLRRTIGSADAPVVLVATGPLTNVARLLLADPDVAASIDRICLMGGAIAEGNWTPAAEFNVWVDPEAARIVFRSGDGSPIHDAVAVAHIAVPGLVETARYHVDVETTGELTRGRTVVDTRGVPGQPPNADVAIGIDRDRFVDLLIEAVATVGTGPAVAAVSATPDTAGPA